MELFMVLALQTSDMLAQGRQVIGLIAALLAAVLAARGSWHVTDRLIAWRRPDKTDGA